MKALFTDEQLKVGTKFEGNVNRAICEIIKIEPSVISYKPDWKGELISKNRRTALIVTIKDCKTGCSFQYGMEALKRCDITIK